MIEQIFLDQIESAIENYDFHEVKFIEIGRNAPINQVVIQCFDLDGNFVYFAFDWEGGILMKIVEVVLASIGLKTIFIKLYQLK